MSKWILILTAAVILFLNSCSEGLSDKVNNTPSVSHGSLLLVDEANKVLKSFKFGGDVSTVGDVGNAANDILIDGDNAYIAVSVDNKLLRISLNDTKNRTALSLGTGSNWA